MRNYAVWSLLLVAFASSSQAQLTLTDRILWPEEGYFLAYPVEEEDDNFKVSASWGSVTTITCIAYTMTKIRKRCSVKADVPIRFGVLAPE